MAQLNFFMGIVMSRMLLNLSKEVKHNTSQKCKSSKRKGDSMEMMMTTMQFDYPVGSDCPRIAEEGVFPAGEHQYMVDEPRLRERGRDESMGLASGTCES